MAKIEQSELLASLQAENEALKAKLASLNAAPDADEPLIREKINAGLSREMAKEVIQAQRAEDAAKAEKK